MRISTRNRLIAVCFSTIAFASIALVFVSLASGSPARAFGAAVVTGLLIGLFEEFYVRGRHGRWLRTMHPAKSLALYSVAIALFTVIAMLVNMNLLGIDHDAHRATMEGAHASPIVYALPLLVLASVVAIMALRVGGYVGGRNLLYLLTGRYHRPQWERKIFMFLDIKESTALVDRLGAVQARALIGKVFFDISAPITDLGGDIYRFTGDGVVAVWDWDKGSCHSRIARTIDAIEQAVYSEEDRYRSDFDHVPEFRIGVHGGPIIACEEGDTKRAIGYYGDTIHIAARLEQQARELGVDYVLSRSIAELQTGFESRLREVGNVAVRGLSEVVAIYEFRSTRVDREFTQSLRGAST